MVTVIDGRNLIHGRLASVVAERIMNGEEIVVLNAEAIVITGPSWYLKDATGEYIIKSSITRYPDTTVLINLDMIIIPELTIPTSSPVEIYLYISTIVFSLSPDAPIDFSALIIDILQSYSTHLPFC
jgi:hypothetical protein